MNFWLRLAIQESITVVSAYLAQLTPQQAADGQALIAAAEKFLGDF